LFSQQAVTKPLRLAIAGMSHGHVDRILERSRDADIQIVGIYETDRGLTERYAKQYGLRQDTIFDDLEKMLDTVKPEAVTAFGTTYDHLRVVQSAAPRGIHVMVEKPLAVDLKQARAIQALAHNTGIQVLTNYETTWYPTTQAIYDLARDQQGIGPIRKIVVHDGHSGPKEIHVSAEFLKWLTDPVLDGGGALMDFGCYGANLVTWLMNGAEPLSVTAVTQQIKPEVYPRVEDEATILLTYPKVQAIIQASWNWPFDRKDIEVYGLLGYVQALDKRRLRIRKHGDAEEHTSVSEESTIRFKDPFAYLSAVVRGEVIPTDNDLSALGNNLVVMKILTAAKESAATGKTVKLAQYH